MKAKEIGINFKLTDKANIIIGIYRVSHRFKTKAEALNAFIEENGKK